MMMASLQKPQLASGRALAAFRPPPLRSVRCRQVFLVSATADQAVSRRHASLEALLAAATALVATSPARAGLLGDDQSPDDIYKQDTSSLINLVQDSLAVPSDAPDHDDAINKAREGIKDWVAKYRRGGAYTGKPSYGNSYTAFNALAGHYNNFGPSSPLPKKRLERLNKELVDAKKLLDRNR